MSVVVANGKAYLKFQHTDICSIIKFMKLLYPNVEVKCLVNRSNYMSTLLIDQFTIKQYKHKIVVEINAIDDANPVIRKAIYRYLQQMLRKYKTVEPFNINRNVQYTYDVNDEIIKSYTPIHKYKKHFEYYLIE